MSMTWASDRSRCSSPSRVLRSKRSGNAQRNSTAIAAKTTSLMVLSMRGSQSKPWSRPWVTASLSVITRAATVAKTIAMLKARARIVVRCSRTWEAPGLTPAPRRPGRRDRGRPWSARVRRSARGSAVRAARRSRRRARRRAGPRPRGARRRHVASSRPATRPEPETVAFGAPMPLRPDTRPIDLEPGGRGMGFFDRLKDALGGDHHDRDDAAVGLHRAPRTAPSTSTRTPPSPTATPSVTGGKHAARTAPAVEWRTPIARRPSTPGAARDPVTGATGSRHASPRDEDVDCAPKRAPGSRRRSPRYGGRSRRGDASTIRPR